jgi:REP element-mobilizing transposase RayT
MSRPLRMFVAGGNYLVTARCLQRRLFLRPSAEALAVLEGVLARALRLYGVEAFAFNFVSNHFHLVVRAPRGNLPRFMQYLMTNISKKIGALIGWRGAFWERRYSAEPILDDDALLAKVQYVLAHGPKEGLVRHCREWPGLSCLPLMLDGGFKPARWFNWTRRASGNRHGESRDRLDPRWSEPEELRLTELPIPSLHAPGALRRFVQRAVKAIEDEAVRQYKKFKGRRWVLNQSPLSKPKPSERRPRPACHTSIPALRDAYREHYRNFVAAFRVASARWRAGEFATAFPEGAIRPFILPRVEASPLAA